MIKIDLKKMENNKIHIAIVDDHTLFRNGVAALMAEFDELEMVFEAENGQQLQQALAKHGKPDVILMDINMPVMDGYATTKWVKQNYPKVRVLALSMFEDDKAVIQMIKCGAGGYVLKESRPRELLEAIKAIHEKGTYINEMVSGKLLRSVSDIASARFTATAIGFSMNTCLPARSRSCAISPWSV